jgi:hypothetical protein
MGLVFAEFPVSAVEEWFHSSHIAKIGTGDVIGYPASTRVTTTLFSITIQPGYMVLDWRQIATARVGEWEIPSLEPLILGHLSA